MSDNKIIITDTARNIFLDIQKRSCENIETYMIGVQVIISGGMKK